MAQGSKTFDPWSDQGVQYALRSSADPPAPLSAELDRVRGLRRALGASLKDIVNSWPLSPVSFCARPPSVVYSSTRGLTVALRSSILDSAGACIRFDPDWVAADVRQFGVFADTIRTAERPLDFPEPRDIVHFYRYILSDEGTVSFYLHTQLQVILQYALPLVHPPRPGLEYGLASQPGSLASATRYGINKPDFVFGLHGQDSTDESLMTGEIRLSVVMSLSVMRWIVWWARQNYRVQMAMPDDLWLEQKEALQILRQVWGQQVVHRVRRLFLSNGDYFLFFSARFPCLIDSYVSHIYSHTGDMDPYDGRLLPSTAVDQFIPGVAPWPHVPGLLTALAAAAVHSIAIDGPWPERPDDPGFGQGDESTEVVPESPGDVGDAYKGRAPASTYAGPQTRSATRRGSRICMSNRAALQGLHFAVPAHFRPGPHAHVTRISLSPALPTPTSFDLYTPEGTPELIDSTTSEHSSPEQVLPSLTDSVFGQQHLAPHTGRSDSTIGDADILFEALLGSGSFADVFSGTLTPSDESSTSSGVINCAFKFVRPDTFKRSNWGYEGRPCTTKTAIPILRAEAAVLLALTETLAVPRFYGYWEGTDIEGRLYAFIAMERLAGAASSSMDEADKYSVIRVLDRLHQAEVVHGDLELRHIRRTLTARPGDEGWRIIDLERARRASKEEAAAELRAGHELLGIVPDPAPRNAKVDTNQSIDNGETTNNYGREVTHADSSQKQ